MTCVDATQQLKIIKIKEGEEGEENFSKKKKIWCSKNIKSNLIHNNLNSPV